MTIAQHAPPLRSQAEVRAKVDEKLGSGVGMSSGEAAAKLSPLERVEWLLGELFFSLLDKRFHSWVQGYALGGGVDGPRVIAAIAEEARPLNPRIAELLRWTAARGAAAASGERPEGLFDVVSEVWNGSWSEVPAFMRALVERWPEDLDPLSLPPAPAWSRRITSRSDHEPRYPDVRVAFTEYAHDCALEAPPNVTGIIETVAFALWEGGASDDDLDAFFGESINAGKQLPEACSRWVSVDGGGADAAWLELLRQRLFPRHPLAIELGLDSLPALALIRLPLERLAPIESSLKETATIRIRATAEATFAQYARAALRQDPETLLVDAGELAPEDAPLLLNALQTGHLVVICGDSAGAAALEAKAAEYDTPVLRPVLR